MSETSDARVMLSREDLLSNARLIDTREPDPDAELARLLLVRRFLAASLELTRALRAQTHCALVNHCGTAGSHSLQEATEALFGALAEYALRCREVAEEARQALVGSAAPRWEPDDAEECRAAAC